MPTTTQSAPTHDVAPRGLRSAKASAISLVLASIATLVIVVAKLHSAGDEPAQMQSVPAQPNTVSQRVAAPTVVPPSAAPRLQPAALTMNDRGFVDSTARCDSGQDAVAIARTNRSAMVVCRVADGTLVYQGIRLRDGASLRLDDVRVIPTGFEAHNDGTTYRLSPTELVVITGEAQQSRDPILEYRAG